MDRFRVKLHLFFRVVGGVKRNGENEVSRADEFAPVDERNCLRRVKKADELRTAFDSSKGE